MMSGDHDLSIDQLRDIVQDAHLNFLVGAGASSEYFSVLGDTENLLAEIDNSTAGEAARTRARASIYASFFQSVLVRNRQLIGADAGAARVLESYTLFLQTINRVLLRRRSSIINKQVNVFTTNVDLTIEVSAEKLQLELNDGFSGRFNPRFSTTNFGAVLSRRSLQYDNLSEIPTFNLLKLHGSVGWITADHDPDGDEARTDILFEPSLAIIDELDSMLAEIDDLLLPVAGETTAQSLLEAEPAADGADRIEAFLRRYEDLPIVNPTKAKFQQTVLNQNYYDLLRIFSNDLEKENSVLFLIGFSCRDEHIRELLVRAARTNPTLQIFIFAYKPASISEIEGRFAGYQTTNGNIRVVGPAQAAEGEDQESYDLRTITRRFFEPLVPRPPRRPDATVEVNVALREPLVPGHD
ncbi:hypothetical protein [uncultured Jatrophihabitans sp.]|uniref:hypothetical protein n=1 Tax=uncultured Jatrophihabitans sp. TaxID=1610747 RepID=UPI0035CC31C8